ncbi:MAG: hypothetical protein QM503_07935, partial [Bacteroidota bacterium]
DSVMKIPYEWHFPIMGDKIRKLGFDIPFPNGIMVNYIVGTQYVSISNLSIGLHDDPDSFINVDGIARFEQIKPFVNVINVRYDVWLLPFIDLYALGGYVHSKTDIKMALPFQAEFTSESEGPMVGWGIAAAGGIGPFFAELDYNMAWTFVQQLYEPSLAQIFDIRVGHTFKFPGRPWSNISVLIGAEWLRLTPYSRGSVDISAAIGGGDNGDKQEDLTDWYDELPQMQQETFREFYETIHGALGGEDDKYLYYEFDKKMPYPWSMTLGLDYQINHRYLLNAFYTFLGSRNQLVIGFNYRFGFKGKNVLAGVTF